MSVRTFLWTPAEEIRVNKLNCALPIRRSFSYFVFGDKTYRVLSLLFERRK